MSSSLSAVLLPSQWPTTAWVLVLTTVATAFYKLLWRPSFPQNAPKWYKKGDWPIVGALDFYYGPRLDFVRGARDASKTGNASFYIGKKHLVLMTGAESRKTYFDNKELKFSDAFADLLTGQPQPPAAQSEQDFDQMFIKALVPLMKKENFVRNLDKMTGDTRFACKELAAAAPSKADPEWRVTDPFESIYEIVYQLTMRVVGANEIAEDRKLLRQTLMTFDWFERADSFARVIFPWLPTLNHYMRLFHGARLAFVFRDIIEKRKKTGKKENDALQFLIDRGLNLQDIVGFEIGSLYAGQLNSGINAGYLLINLTQNPEWMKRLRDEVDTSVKRHRTSPSQSRADVLDTLVVEDWESEFPLIDMALRETIRLSLPGTSFRKNTSGHDIPIGNTGEVIPAGAYAVYPIEDIHFNNWYADPMKWDPSRYFEERAEDKKTPYGYVGWGLGRHPCLGMKFAKLEMAFITAYFIATFDFELSDKDGNLSKPKSTPSMDMRHLHAAKKPKENVYLRYKSRKD
ncbi:cytochrome P450 6A1 [Xylaria sp. CBS 124048]|nr:cytochrome P450 6A1 [Xylaria sp. CBS 124048]